MPSKSPKQARMMAAVAHNPAFAAKVGIQVSVGKEYNHADHLRGLHRAAKSSPMMIRTNTVGRARSDG